MVTADVTAVGGGGYWRLEMRLGLLLGYGNAFGVESGPECWGGGGYWRLEKRLGLVLGYGNAVGSG